MKPGGNTKTAFEGLARIARTDDGLLNRAIGEALVSAGLAQAYETEKPLGTALRYDSDLFVMRNDEPIRIEVMWRTTTGRAEIANYVLTKLGNYAKAIGLIE
jgi:DNA (cytosine-5)-methyltransferase 1